MIHIEPKLLKKLAVPLLVVVLVSVLTTVILIKRKHVTIVIDGKPTSYITYKKTVSETLKNKDITLGPKDKINPPLDDKIKDKSTITIKRAVNVKLAVDGKVLDILSPEEDIKSVLSVEGIALNGDDRVDPIRDTRLSEGLNISVVRVEKKVVSVSTPIEFNTVVKTDSSLANTKKKIAQEGQNGETETKYNVTYENGIEVLRTLDSEAVVKNPVNKIVVQGTYPLMPVSRGGDLLPYSRVFTANATAYWAVRGIGKTYTASGRLAVRNPDGYSTIAVDPTIIPYGTKLFVEGYGFAIAADTGTGIKGDRIDVYFNTRPEACDWAVKYVKVYILN
ncbi:MAG: 3D domain-containing protein [Bacillota bacterium]|nr:3D domain-containing protein [Bacillota bacterium]